MDGVVKTPYMLNTTFSIQVPCLITTNITDVMIQLLDNKIHQCVSIQYIHSNKTQTGKI